MVAIVDAIGPMAGMEMRLSLAQRTREIGVLRALGSSRWQVRATMLDESLMLTLAGSLVGIGAGTLIGAIWMRGVDEVMPGMSFHFPTAMVGSVAVAAVILGVIAAILPARRAARLKVISALNYE